MVLSKKFASAPMTRADKYLNECIGHESRFGLALTYSSARV
jgi:hypothetical protein